MPLGGVIAGLAIPLLVEAVGWRMALVIAGAVLVGRHRADLAVPLPHRSRRATRWWPRGWSASDGPTSSVPLRSLSRAPGLWRISWVGCLLAFPQAVLGHVRGDLSRGRARPVAQRGGPGVRGDAGDQRRRPRGDGLDRRPCRVQHHDPGAGVGRLRALDHRVRAGHARIGRCGRCSLLAAVAGIAVSGWNGVQIAEVARRSPPGLVGETAAGSVILVYASNMLGPVGFAAFVALTGRFDYAFMMSGRVQPALPAAASWHRPRDAKNPACEPATTVAAKPRKCLNLGDEEPPYKTRVPCTASSGFISTARGGRTAAATRARTSSIRRPRSRSRTCRTPASPISTRRWSPRRRASRSGRTPRPTTARRSCARPPT